MLIGVDWGGSFVRAFRFGPGGDVVQRRGRGAGSPALRRDDFEPTLAQVIDGWAPDDEAHILLCGMVGSREGWIEVPYVRCPASPLDLARALAPLETRLGPGAIVPGVWCEARGRTDVMRGEETQVFGALEDDWAGVAIAPGTHAKWIEVVDGRIVGLRTWMTGELFTLMRDHSVLGPMMAAGPHDRDAFAAGARRALADPALASLLFAARAEALVGKLAVGSVSSFVSGALIGAEIAGGVAEFGDAPIALIGQPGLTTLYTQVLELADRRPVLVVDGESAAAKGLWRLDRLRADMES